MKIKFPFLVTSILAGCTSTPHSAPATVSAVFHGTMGQNIGTADITETANGVRVHVAVKGLTPGLHGIHIHAAAHCDAPEFKTAGGHFNPGGKKHGLKNPDGAHAGDMPNIVIAADGSGTLDFEDTGVTLKPGTNSLLSGAGTAFIIHGGADDEKSDPAGNSGARVACAEIK